MIAMPSTPPQGYTSKDFDVTGTVEVQFDGRRVGFIVNDRKGMRVLHTERVAFFDVDLSPNSDRCAVLQKLYRFVGENPEHGFRVYRTAGGLRYLCTSGFFDPCDVQVRAIMERLHVDPTYAALCVEAQHFCARLNPKQSRCKRSPENYAVAAYQFHVGNPSVLPECLHVLKFHDSETKAFSDLPLA